VTLDLAAVREGYKQKYPAYRRLVEVAKPLLEVATKPLKDSVVDGRAKRPSNFVLKAIRKHLERPDEYADPLARINDGAGLRIIVGHLDDAERAVVIVGGVFDVIGSPERTADRYAPNELGYLGIHIQSRLKTSDLPLEETYLGDLDFEIQIQTMAQHAWSTLSHGMAYKPPAGAGSRNVQAKVYRAVALVSLFDEQVAQARAEMIKAPGYRPAVMLETLQREFLDWLDEASDDELSHRVLEAVQRTYTDEEHARFESLIGAFAREHRDRITAALQLHHLDAEEVPLLYQPEVLAIAERLERVPQLLIAAWREAGLPYELLDETATALGRPLR
jgi:putative GTP pyrophosphokinase